MCVIINMPADKPLRKGIIENCFDNNDDGWGIMFYDEEAGRVRVRKGMTKDSLIETYMGLGGVELGIHCRIRTHGATSLDQCHPYMVLNKEEHGIDLYMMHNGIISITQRDSSKSDTWHFVEDELRPILAQYPDLLQLPQFQVLIEERIGRSKLLFLDSTGRFTIYNDHLGSIIQDCWFSNNYSHHYRSHHTSYYGTSGVGGGTGYVNNSGSPKLVKGGTLVTLPKPVIVGSTNEAHVIEAAARAAGFEKVDDPFGDIEDSCGLALRETRQKELDAAFEADTRTTIAQVERAISKNGWYLGPEDIRGITWQELVYWVRNEPEDAAAYAIMVLDEYSGIGYEEMCDYAIENPFDLTNKIYKHAHKAA